MAVVVLVQVVEELISIGPSSSHPSIISPLSATDDIIMVLLRVLADDDDDICFCLIFIYGCDGDVLSLNSERSNALKQETAQ